MCNHWVNQQSASKLVETVGNRALATTHSLFANLSKKELFQDTPPSSPLINVAPLLTRLVGNRKECNIIPGVQGRGSFLHRAWNRRQLKLHDCTNCIQPLFESLSWCAIAEWLPACKPSIAKQTLECAVEGKIQPHCYDWWKTEGFPASMSEGEWLWCDAFSLASKWTLAFREFKIHTSSWLV